MEKKEPKQKALTKPDLYRIKKRLGAWFANEAGIINQIMTMIKLDKRQALKIIVVWQTMLYDFFAPYFFKDNATLKKRDNESEFDLQKSTNEFMYKNFSNLEIRPKYDEEFQKLAGYIVKMAMLFAKEKMVPQKHQGEVAHRMKHISKFQKALAYDDFSSFLATEIENLSDVLIEAQDSKNNEKDPEENNKPNVPDESSSTIVNVKKDEVDIDKGKNDLMTRKEVMLHYRISSTTLWQWEKKSSIPNSVRIGGKVYWRRADITKVNTVN